MIKMEEKYKRAFWSHIVTLMRLNEEYNEGKRKETFDALEKSKEALFETIDVYAGQTAKKELDEMWNALAKLFTVFNEEMPKKVREIDIEETERQINIELKNSALNIMQLLREQLEE